MHIRMRACSSSVREFQIRSLRNGDRSARCSSFKSHLKSPILAPQCRRCSDRGKILNRHGRAERCDLSLLPMSFYCSALAAEALSCKSQHEMEIPVRSTWPAASWCMQKREDELTLRRWKKCSAGLNLICKKRNDPSLRRAQFTDPGPVLFLKPYARRTRVNLRRCRPRLLRRPARRSLS